MPAPRLSFIFVDDPARDYIEQAKNDKTKKYRIRGTTENRNTVSAKHPKKEIPHSRNIKNDTRIHVNTLEIPEHYSNHNSLCSEIINSARRLVLVEVGKTRELLDKGTAMVKFFRDSFTITIIESNEMHVLKPV